MQKVDFPIDIIITWVDQNDLEWQKKHKKYSDIQNDSMLRYRDYGTLKYVFRSIEKYASWVNHIYLVTDNQIPKWLDLSNKKVSIIDHTQIIPQEYLPTFNSNVIDFHLANIPNLSEHFIYFNDDTFLNAPTEPNDFFAANGFIKDNLAFNLLSPSPQPSSNFDHIYVNNLQIINRRFNKYAVQKKLFWKIFNFKNGIWNFASILLLPFPRFSRFYDPHIPLAFCKKDVQAALNNKYVRTFFGNKFREKSDLSIWLVRYFKLLSGKFFVRNRKFGKRYSIEDTEKYSEDIRNSKHNILCINDADVSDEKFSELTNTLSEILRSKFPQKSEFEQ